MVALCGDDIADACERIRGSPFVPQFPEESQTLVHLHPGRRIVAWYIGDPPQAFQSAGDALFVADLPENRQTLFLERTRQRAIRLQIAQIVERLGHAPAVAQLLENRQSLTDSRPRRSEIPLCDGREAEAV